jgi:hypothetical protein
MARNRDKDAERRRGEELARLRGYASRSAQRRFPRHIRNRRQLESYPRSVRITRERVIRATNLKRQEPELTHEQVAAREGTNVEAVLWWAGEAFEHGQLKSADRLFRPMVIWSEGELVDIDVRGSRKASEVGAYFAAVGHYADTGDAARLRRFEGRRVAGRTFETRIGVLEELGRRHELTVESVYRLVA